MRMARAAQVIKPELIEHDKQDITRFAHRISVAIFLVLSLGCKQSSYHGV